jgi:hypothetical protein
MKEDDDMPESRSKLTNRGPAGLLKKGSGKMTNRGPAGMLSKPKKGDSDGEDGKEENGQKIPEGPRNNFKPAAVKVEVVDINSVLPDPMNARLHPERNIEAIKESLSMYGQQTVLKVIRKSRIVIKGNGTLEAAKQLGWSRIAVQFTDLDEIRAAGYGLADNRTAEHARWDFEIVAQIEKMQQEAGLGLPGWSSDEIEALRANEEIHQPIQGGEDQTWQDVWQGMPEFDQQDLSSFKHVVVHFRNQEDLDRFLRLVKQSTGDVRQNSIWFPRAEIDRFADKRYAAKK